MCVCNYFVYNAVCAFVSASLCSSSCSHGYVLIDLRYVGVGVCGVMCQLYQRVQQ